MKNLSRPDADRLKQKGRSKSFYYSVLLHTVLILIVLIGIDWKARSVIVPASAPGVMKATAIDSKKVAAEVAKLKQVDQKKLDAEQQRQHAAEARIKREQERLEKLKIEQAQVTRRKEEENRRLEAETKKLEKAREVASLQKKKAEEDKQRIEEETRRAAEAAAKRQAEEDKKRLTEEKRKQEAAKAEAALRAALAAEEAEHAAAAQASADASELGRFIARINSAINDRFVRPPGLPGGLKCTLSVRLIPGGEVIEARVVQSSGNSVFDRQAENAVLKASPLPVPDEPRLFEQMREINFVFDPES